jgi:LacI family transcriptional regulator
VGLTACGSSALANSAGSEFIVRGLSELFRLTSELEKTSATRGLTNWLRHVCTHTIEISLQVAVSMRIKRSLSAVTLSDVAREAGVSLKTASRALNSEPYVNEKTAAKIREVMTRLDYHPNALARGLKARKSVAIGMIVPNLSDPFNSSAVRAVEEVARANGHIVILANSSGNIDVEKFEIQSLISRQIDGLIIAPADSRHDNLSGIIPPWMRVVTYDQPVYGADLDSVTVPNRQSAEAAAQHLLDHGYKRIVAIVARPSIYTSSERIVGYQDAMENAGLESRVCPVEFARLLTPEWLSEEVINRHHPDAIICMNWVCATLTLRSMRQIGIRLGIDIPFLSFDDFDLADIMTPSISVVRQPSATFGAEAARLLFERMKSDEQKEPCSIILPTELILRESCGCTTPKFHPDSLCQKARLPGEVYAAELKAMP